MNVLYVSTFNRKFWEISGKNMVESFLRTNCDGSILLCYEGFNLDARQITPASSRKKILTYNLAESDFLKNWLEENRDVIPPEMGGKANPKSNPTAFLPWNLRAAGWFRKIVSLDYAMKNYGTGFDCIISVDSDCEFKQKISSSIITKAFDGTNVFYHWGKHRPEKGLGVESGFIGFMMTKDGKEILQYWIDKYKNKEFRRYAKWDDGGMFTNVLLECKHIKTRDVVGDYDSDGRKSHVIEHGIFAKYLIHNKGIHRNLGLTNDRKKK